MTSCADPEPNDTSPHCAAHPLLQRGSKTLCATTACVVCACVCTSTFFPVHPLTSLCCITQTRVHDAPHPTQAGANWYSDLSWDQFETDVLADHAPPSPANMPGRARRAMSRHLLADLPQEVDWRTHGKVTPPRHQGRCGSCWAFAAVALVESAALMANASLPLGALDLSEAHTAFCCAGDRAICAQSNGCKGGTPVDGLAYIKRYGITTEAKAPYK